MEFIIKAGNWITVRVGINGSASGPGDEVVTSLYKSVAFQDSAGGCFIVLYHYLSIPIN